MYIFVTHLGNLINNQSELGGHPRDVRICNSICGTVFGARGIGRSVQDLRTSLWYRRVLLGGSSCSGSGVQSRK